MNDLSIVVHQRSENPNVQPWRRRRPLESDNTMDRKGTGRVRVELDEGEKGTIPFYTGSVDGPVEICTQSMSAHPDAPSRVALNVTMRPTEESELLEENVETNEDNGQQQQARRHISRMTADLNGMERKIRTILSNADYAKEQEIQFHEQSIAMNRASQYWPMIHLVVLLITGFTQANHIIRFFKSRRVF